MSSISSTLGLRAVDELVGLLGFLAEIGLYHLWIAGDLIRGSLGDLRSVVEDHHAVRNAHDRLHDVLDHDDRRATVPHAADELHHCLSLYGIEPRDDLVQQEHPRPRAE